MFEHLAGELWKLPSRVLDLIDRYLLWVIDLFFEELGHLLTELNQVLVLKQGHRLLRDLGEQNVWELRLLLEVLLIWSLKLPSFCVGQVLDLGADDGVKEHHVPVVVKRLENIKHMHALSVLWELFVEVDWDFKLVELVLLKLLQSFVLSNFLVNSKLRNVELLTDRLA